MSGFDTPRLTLLCAALLCAAFAVPARAEGVDGIWGVAGDPKAAPNCKAYVMVLRAGKGVEAGRYVKAILDLGTTVGPRDAIIGRSDWILAGDRLLVAPSLSLARPEPEQVFLWDRVSDTLVRESPSRLLFRRCPDRELLPMDR